MIDASHSEENWRLDVALAAMEVAGTADRCLVLDGSVPEDRRAYLYAVPDGEDGGDRFGASALSGAVGRATVPVGVDHDRESPTRGLRYLADFSRMPAELRAFAGDGAREAWSAWKDREREASRTVVRLAGALAEDPGRDLDGEFEQRASDRASPPADRGRPQQPRRTRSDERS